MNNVNVKIKMIKSIYMSMGNHTQGHYNLKYLLAKLFEYENIMKPYIYSWKRDKITIKLIQTLKYYKINIHSRINMK